MRVEEAGEPLALVLEGGHGVRVSDQRGLEDLDRDRPVQAGLPRPVDRRDPFLDSGAR
jgi:hypothetical protein